MSNIQPTNNNQKLIKGVTYGPIQGVTYGDEGLIPGVYYDYEDKVETESKFENLQIVPSVIQATTESPIDALVPVTSALNFELKLLRRIIMVYNVENGEEKVFKYHIQIFVHLAKGNVLVFDDEVAGDKAKETRWLKKATNSLATIPKGKNEVEEYEAKVQRCLETENCPLEIVYPTSGWRNVPQLGWRYIYGEGYIGSKDNLIHAVRNGRYSLDLKAEKIGDFSVFKAALDMRYICRSRVASTTLFLFVHAAVLSELFEQAGHPLNFAFGVVGVTNSRKTSLVTAMAQLFHRENLKADAEFATATSCGIEKTLGIYKDAPVLIDDFKPGVNRSKQTQLDEKLDEVLRFAGNRVAKQRMTDFMPEGNKKFFPIYGGIVMTMELVTGVLSSMTRLFLTEINAGEVINERLQIYQDEKWILPTHIYDFLQWATENFMHIVNFICQKFSQLRSRYETPIGRYSEIYATFVLTAAIFGQYAQTRAFWDGYQTQEFLDDVELILVGELHRMEDRARRRDKGELVVEAFREALERGVLNPIRLNRESVQGRYDLYENDFIYFIRARKMKCLTNEYAKANQERTEIVNDDELIGLLERLDVLEVYERADGTISRSRKLPIQTGNAFCYLYLKKDRLRELESQ